MLKRVLIIIMSLLLTAGMIAGCSTQQPAAESSAAASTAASLAAQESSESTEADSTEPVTITFTVSDAVPRGGLDAVIAAAKEKLNITVELDIIASAGSEDIMKTRLATGDMSDMFNNNPGAQMNAMLPEDNMYDLSAYADLFDDTFVEAASYNGKLYGVPLGSSNGGVMWYNKTVADKLGIGVPKTWDEFLANCEVAKQAGITPMVGSYKDDWSSQIILLADYYNVAQADSEFYSNFENNKAKYATTPAALRSWQKLADSKNLMNEDYLATTCDVACDMLAKGEALYWPMLTQLLPTFAELYPDVINDIGVFPIPSDDPAISGITVWPSNSIHVYKESQNIDACLKFLDFYYSEEGLAIYEANNQATGPYHVKGMELGDNVYTAVKDMVPYFDSGKTVLAMEFFTSVKGPNCPAICVSCGSGMITPEEAAAQYDADCEKQAVQLGIEGW